MGALVKPQCVDFLASSNEAFEFGGIVQMVKLMPLRLTKTDRRASSEGFWSQS